MFCAQSATTLGFAQFNLHALGHDPGLSFLIGVVGLAATVIGVVLAVKGNRSAAAANAELARLLSEERDRIVKGVAGVLQKLPPLEDAATSIPPLGGAAAVDSETFLSEKRKDEPPAAANLLPPVARRHTTTMESVSTADVTNDGSPDLLVEQPGRGRSSLKVFSWEGFDLVLVGDLSNSSGARFLAIEDPAGKITITTLDLDNERQIERLFIWNGQELTEERRELHGDVGRFFDSPQPTEKGEAGSPDEAAADLGSL